MTRLAEILQRESKLVARLLALLHEEQQQLKSGQVDSLEALSQQKSSVIEEINQLDRERLAVIGPDAGTPEGMARWLKVHPAEKAAAGLWQQLLDITREARALHDANGAIVNTLLKRTGDALGVLLHQGEQGLYSADGQTAGNAGGRIVDSA